MDGRHLPFKDLSLKSIIIDPPFLTGGSNNGIMTNKYGRAGGDGGSRSMQIVWDLYRDIMTECYRVLKLYGTLVVKCQDCLNGRTNYMTHIEVSNVALGLGMYPKDLFVLLALTRPKAWNHKNQHHARKHHSYFYVFGKQKRTVGYSGATNAKYGPRQ